MTEHADNPKPRFSGWQLLVKPSGNAAKILTLLLLGGLLYSSHYGYLHQFEQFLSDERYAFRVGSYEVTAYAVLKSIFIVVLLFWITAIIASLGEKRIGNMRHIRSNTRQLLIKLFQIVLYSMAFLVGLDMLGIQLTTLTVFSGALGIGIGFGLQKITSNFISGMILLLEKTIEQDDLIELSGGDSGFVRRISARFTLIETSDGRDILVPNEEFITQKVVNWTYSNKRGRVEIDVGVTYDADLERTQEILLDCARAHPRCSRAPAPSCYLSRFGDKAVEFKLYFWVDDAAAGRAGPKSDVLLAIWHALKEAGIAMPLPEQDVNVRMTSPAPDATPSPAPATTRTPAPATTRDS